MEYNRANWTLNWPAHAQSPPVLPPSTSVVRRPSTFNKCQHIRLTLALTCPRPCCEPFQCPNPRPAGVKTEICYRVENSQVSVTVPSCLFTPEIDVVRMHGKDKRLIPLGIYISIDWFFVARGGQAKAGPVYLYLYFSFQASSLFSWTDWRKISVTGSLLQWVRLERIYECMMKVDYIENTSSRWL